MPHVEKFWSDVQIYKDITADGGFTVAKSANNFFHKETESGWMTHAHTLTPTQSNTTEPKGQTLDLKHLNKY